MGRGSRPAVNFGEGRRRGGSERQTHLTVPPGYWRQHVCTRKSVATREIPAGARGTGNRALREEQAWPAGKSERPVVARKPGNAGGAKGP